ncbi:hypothetical protein [Flavobacterium sp. TBRC 19031]|uniref:hypothetical protein n=1 Tax=Flavobacterium mekongense TaxID=3379707 RepID=UPI00399A0605
MNSYNPTYKEINIKELKLDKENPRLPKSLRGKSDEVILNYMLLDASLIELMLAIGVNGFFPGEQLLVVRDKDQKYKVIEGNRRFSAVTLLNNPELATVQTTAIERVLKDTTERPVNIPCLIFSSEENIHTYLGFRHITGIKEWRLLEKARYLHSLWLSNFSDKSVDNAAREIAKIIGSKRDYVKRILIGFEIYKRIEDADFYKIRDLNDTTFYFNYIADSLNKSNIAKFLGVELLNENPIENFNEQNLEKWTQWLFQKNDQNKTRLLGDSADLADLNAIIGNEAALIAFDQKGYTLERAKELTGELDVKFKLSIQKALQNLEFADSLVARVKEFYPELEDDLKAIRTTSSKIRRVIEEIRDDED